MTVQYILPKETKSLMVFSREMQKEAKKDHAKIILTQVGELLRDHGFIERYDIRSETDLHLYLFVKDKDYCFHLHFYLDLGTPTDLASIFFNGSLMSASRYEQLRETCIEGDEDAVVVRNGAVEDLIGKQQSIFLNPLVLSGRVATAILSLV